MKTLGKLNINPERIIKKEELVTLRGGYGTCWCTSCSNYGQYIGPGNAVECSGACFEIGCASIWTT